MRVVLTLDAADLCQITGTDRYDLHTAPQGIDRLQAARTYPPLRNLLTNLNAHDSLFATFASKVWTSSETGGAEPCVFGSRVDIVFLSEAINYGLGPLENLARRLGELLEREPTDALRAELRVASAELTGYNSGYCLRFLLTARGATPEQAEVRWGLGLARAQQALLFLARTLRQQAFTEHD